MVPELDRISPVQLIAGKWNPGSADEKPTRSPLLVQLVLEGPGQPQSDGQLEQLPVQSRLKIVLTK